MKRVSDNKKRPDPRSTPSAPAEKAKRGKPKAVPKLPVARRTKKAPTPAAATRAQPRSAQKRLSILMVASEVHPYAKTGGLAEVAAALPAALGRLGHRVTLVLPRYRGIDIAGARSQSISIQLGGRTLRIAFRTTEEH